MSTLFQTATCLSVFAFLCPSQLVAAEQHEYFFAIAEGVPPEVRLAMGNKMQTLIGSELTPGSLVHVLRLPSYQSLATFKVPHGSRNSRLKNRRLASAWQNVLPFLKNPETKGSTQVDLPRLPAKLRELRQSDFPVRVVLVGSLLYDNPQYPVWKFNPWVPSDGCLKADFCPFTGGVSDFPSGTKISWIAPAADLALDQPLVESIKRFYRLFCAEHGGQIVRLGDSPDAAFRFDRLQFPDRLTLRNDGILMRDPKVKTVIKKTKIAPPVEIPHTNSTLPPATADKPPVPEKTTASAAPIDSVLQHSLPSNVKNIAMVIDYSDSIDKGPEKKCDMTWKKEKFLADACKRLRTLDFQKFAVIGFYGKAIDKKTVEARYHFFRPQLQSPSWIDGSAENREAACEALVSWPCSGGTPTLKALKTARRLEGITTIFLYTDGLPSVTPASEVQQYVRQLATEGITVHTVGIGPLPATTNSNSLYDEEGAAFMLETAAAGGGHYIEI